MKVVKKFYCFIWVFFGKWYFLRLARKDQFLSLFGWIRVKIHFPLKCLMKSVLESIADDL